MADHSFPGLSLFLFPGSVRTLRICQFSVVNARCSMACQSAFLRPDLQGDRPLQGLISKFLVHNLVAHRILWLPPGIRESGESYNGARTIAGLPFFGYFARTITEKGWQKKMRALPGSGRIRMPPDYLCFGISRASSRINPSRPTGLDR